MASAAALPGQAMYPFKRAIEQLRLASVQWSPAREAGERTRVADERLEEVESLVDLGMFNQLPNALNALERAVLAAEAAVSEAAREGEPVPRVAAKLSQVTADGGRVVLRVAAVASLAPLPAGTKEAIQTAVSESRDVLPPPTTPAAAPKDVTPPPTSPTNPTTPATQPTGATPTQPTQGPDPTQPEPPTTAPPTTAPQTTAPPPTTPPTSAPPPSDDTGATPGSGGTPAGGATGGYGPTPAEAPTTTSGATP
jgi:hypothetical protein